MDDSVMLESAPVDMTPICWCCGERMETHRNITVNEQNEMVMVYEWVCVNPMCECCEEERP